MFTHPQKSHSQRNKFILSLTTMLTFLVSLLLSGGNVSAQTLKLRFPFDDAGPGTTTASDTSGGGLAVTLNMENQTNGVGVDLHGAAGSGVQGQGRSLNLTANPISGNAAGSIAFVTNDPNIGTLGVISNFTVSMWFKLVSPPTNTANQGSRLFILGTNGVIDQGVANSIAMLINTAAAPSAGFPSNAIAGRINTSQFTVPIYYPLATNVWQFVAMTYDGGSNAIIYYGTEASPAKLLVVNNVGPQTVNLGPTANLQLGNRLNGRVRPLAGSIDDFRFYVGTGDVNFVEGIRQASCPVVISGLTPDGSTLLEGTNTLAFTASSANTISTNAIKVSLNGTDISSNLVFGGTPSAVTVSYSALPVNPTIVNNSSLNGVTLGIQVTDASGIVASNQYTYDAFSPTNFTWEAEDYNFTLQNPPLNGGGLFIDNPRYAFVSDTNTYWQKAGELLDDYNDNGNLGGPLRVYRSTNDAVETEFCLGGGNNGGVSMGELTRQKVLDAFALDPTVREVNVGFFDGGAGSGLPNWMNYTRTYPSGIFNVYTRVAAGTGVSALLDNVTSGVGTTTQTTTNLGTFVTPNTGGWDSFAWSPLRDASGNLIRVTLGGVSTLRLTAGPSGGGNNNFLMLTAANTNLPSISGIYPNGTNMFQPTNAFTFTVSSPTGVTINSNSIHVQLTATSITSTTVTNLSATNGLTITGTASSKNVSGVLQSNVSYVEVISATDINGSPASQTVIFDTYAPVLTWEGEDYDYGGGLTLDPAITTDAYSNLQATLGVDYNSISNGAQHAYRSLDTPGMGTEPNGDGPLRLAYIGTGFTDYDLGWYDASFWVNYTRTIPAGQWNIVARLANGSGGNGGVVLSKVTSGVGTTNQVTTNLGTCTVPATGGWQAYVWVPMRDAGGNLAKFIGTGAQQTIRGTSQGGLNVNFYMLIPANTNQPLITGLFPDGTSAFQNTNKLVFTVTATGGATISQSNVTLTLDGVVVSGLQFVGTPTSWNVTYPNLPQNAPHTATINVIDSNGNTATTTVSFDTFKPTYYQWEAEDYDYADTNGNSGLFFDNPQVDAYAGLSASNGVDYVSANGGGVFLYRPVGAATGVAPDFLRAQFTGTNVDYEIGFFSAGAWCNYTRHYPAGNYNVWGRFAAGGGDSIARLSIVTGGWGTANQTSNLLGSFAVPNTGWNTFLWSPLRDAGGNLVTVPITGTTNTLKLQRTDPSEAIPDVNANFMMLVPLASPVVLTATRSGANINISFQTTSGFNYQVQYKNNLTDPSWTALGSPVVGDGTIKSVVDPTSGSSRFYRVQIQ
jgi:hypothetical protein